MIFLLKRRNKDWTLIRRNSNLFVSEDFTILKRFPQCFIELLSDAHSSAYFRTPRAEKRIASWFFCQQHSRSSFGTSRDIRCFKINHSQFKCYNQDKNYLDQNIICYSCSEKTLQSTMFQRRVIRQETFMTAAKRTSK